MPAEEISTQIMPHELGSWEGHPFLAAHVARELVDQPPQVGRRRVFGLSSLVVIVPVAAAFLAARPQSKVVNSPLPRGLSGEITDDSGEVVFTRILRQRT